MTAGDAPEPGRAPPSASTKTVLGRWGSLAAVGSGNVGVLLFGVVSGVISARFLGPSLRGEFVAAQTWAGTAAVLLTLGVTQAIVTYRGEDGELVGPIALQCTCGMLFGILMFVVLSGSELTWLTPLGIVGGAALTAGGLLGSLSAGYAQRLGRMRGAFQSVRLIPQGLIVVVVVGLAVAGSRDPNQWVLGVGLSVLVPSVFLMIRLLGGSKAILHIARFRPNRALVLGARGAFILVVGSQLIYRFDSLLVAAYLPADKIALYAVAVTAAGACSSIGSAVGMLTFSRMRGVDNRAEQRAIIRKGTLRALIVTASVAVPVAVVTPWAIELLYGSAFVPATGATRVLVMASVPLSADYLLVHALLSLFASRSAFHVQVLAATLTIGLLVPAILTENLELIASVSVLVYSVSASLLFLSVLRRTTEPPVRSQLTGLGEQ